MSYHCKECNKFYKTSNSLYVHKSKYHKKTTIITCDFCDKEFKHASSKSRHQKTCKHKPSTQIRLSDNSSNLQITDSKTIESLLKILSQSISGINNHSRNNTQNMSDSQNITNSGNTNNTTNNITVYALGKENIPEILSAAEQRNILKQKKNSLEEIIKLVHFNNKYPQFHNIAINDDVAYKYDNESKTFVEVPKDDLIQDVIDERTDDIGKMNKKQKIHMPKMTYEIIDKYISGLDTESNSIVARDKTESVIYDGTDYLISNKKIKLPNYNDNN